MKKYACILLLLASFLLIFSTTLAAGNDPVGTRIILSVGPTSMPADTPFHIIHGWSGISPNNSNPGHRGFEVDIDGVFVKNAYALTTGTKGTGSLTRLWLYNFQDGLPAGTYVFTGHWYLSCTEAVDYGIFPGPCATPHEKMEVFTIPQVVTFS